MHFLSVLFPIPAQDGRAGETQPVRASAIGRFVPAPSGNARYTKRWERKRGGTQRGKKKDFPQHQLANQWAVGQTRRVTSAQRCRVSFGGPDGRVNPRREGGGGGGGWAAALQGAHRDIGPRALNWGCFVHPHLWGQTCTSPVPRITLVPPGQSEPQGPACSSIDQNPQIKSNQKNNASKN